MLPSGEVKCSTDVQWKVYSSCMSRLKKRLVAANLSEATINSYTRAVGKLLSFLHFLDLQDMEIDEVIDFIAHLVEDKQINWRTQKFYTAVTAILALSGQLR